MAVSVYFQDEIDEVDATKTLSYDSAASGYDFWEWSYSSSGSVYTILGGSELACEHGAAHLLDAMGFRFYTPNDEFWVRPVSITMGLTAAKQQYWMPGNRYWQAYGHSFESPYTSSRTALNDAMTKWQRLNGVAKEVYTAGHRWAGIVTNSFNSAWFTANPQYRVSLDGSNSSESWSFPLESLTSEEYDTLVELCAATLLYDRGLNTTNDFYLYDRTHFDPTDGDTQSSDVVFPFAKAVAAKVRSGTNAVGPHPSRTGRPNAQIGIYGYGGHKLPPTDSASPGVFTLIALGFNGTPYTFEQLILRHAQKADLVALREYLDVQVWFMSAPFTSRTKKTYFDRYDEYVTNGALGASCESSGNWLVTLLMARIFVKKVRSGTADEDAILAEIVADVFDDDPKVLELYEFWRNQYQSYHKWNLKESFAIVDQMATSWYKTYFQHYLCILYELEYLPDKLPTSDPDWNTASDPFPAAFSKLCAHILAVRDYDIIHSYALLRRIANGNVSNDYPALWMYATTKPDWWNSPYLPTETDFDDYYTAIQADTYRAADLDSDDLVAMNLTPVVSATTPATAFYIDGTAASWKVIGPSTVSITGQEARYDEETGDFIEYVDVSEVTDYAEGLHFFQTTGDVNVTWSGGQLFLEYFPITRMEANGETAAKWLYIPGRCEGEVSMEIGSRVSVEDQDGTFDALPVGHADYEGPPSNIGPGQIKLTAGTTGFNAIINASKYISPEPTIALLPRAIAEEDFPSRIAITVA